MFAVARVMRAVVPTHKINEWDGTPLRGTFDAQDLQKVTVMDDDLFRVEKIVKRKGDRETCPAEDGMKEKAIDK